ncbi:MAG: M56 family metallopeptidase [Lachnospiraceae bacterium]|nr:M56 family metallopeptidase [Lachnospiraceae bacterium]
MNVIEEYFLEIIKIILTMTFTGSMVSLFLFAIKPFIKDKLPKSFQYYMWFPVIIALMLPLSKIVVIPAPSNSAASMKSMNDIAQWVTDTAFEKPVNFILAPQTGNGQEILQTTERSPSIAMIIFILWQLGMISVLSFNIICYVLYVRRIKKHNKSADQQDIELLDELSGSKNTPRLYKNSMVATPVLIGVFRPEIILPDKKYEDRKLQGILLHEITHMRKYDIAVKWLLILVGALHWFNPIIYFVLREMNKACELACDESVIKNFDNDSKQHYGDALIMVAADASRKIPISITMFNNKKILKERLGAIMQHKEFPKKAIYLSCLLLAMIICGTFYLGMARSSVNSENGSAIAYADENSIQSQRYLKEFEVEQALCDYDKDNIVKVYVHAGISDNEIIDANIFVVCKDEITDVDEQDKIKAIAAEHFDIDAQNVYIEYVDSEPFIQGSNADETAMESQRRLKEYEVQQALCNYDKDNIALVAVHVGISDNEIIDANIFIVGKDEVTDADEQEKIKAIVAEHLNIDAQNVYVEYMNNEAF